jgi:protein-S-isoprenylcysteine O-methyltransferase Ste14
MWVWIVVAALFLFLLGKSLSDSMGTTSSRNLAFLGTVLDGLAMIAGAIAVFGLLMALVLGVFAASGPRLTGDSLRDVLLWSAGLIVLAAAMLAAGTAVRNIGARRPAAAQPSRGR